LSLTLAALVIVASAAFLYFNRKPVLTDKDTILLADFVNTTGDPAFDGAIKQALAIQLEQSPFLNIFTDERVQETLRFMERSPDERLTREVAREICERVGLKAMLVGSIAPIGSHYVIAIDAVNAHNGDVLAREQVEAESKDQVLSVLGKAATRLREKLGESLITIQKFDVPLAQATTSSLEALKAFSAGTELALKRKFPEAHPFLKRAVELDPTFVGAYVGLAINSGNLGERESSKQYITKAFQLRGRASEREKLRIEAGYHHATGELEEAIEALELLKQTYPRDASAGNLGVLNAQLGNYERALDESVEALRLNPTWLTIHLNVAHVLITLGRYDEAREVVQRAQAQKLDNPTQFHWVLYRIAFDQGDAAAMQSELEHLRASPGPEFLWLSAWTAEANGQLRKDREMTGQVAELFKRQNQRERAADETARNARPDALYGHCELVRKDAASALSIGRTPESLRRTALAFALCGDLGQAQSLAEESARLLPTDTLANTIWLPVIRAAMAIHRGNHAKAIELLQAARRYDRADLFSAHYLRGLAYLGQRSAVEAGAEFQFILDHRGLASYSPFYPLAHLGLARAYVVSGDTEKARKAYEDFFELWKDADADLPILIEAKKEYAALK
jgi:tetratricopeptide (TPR) repeat protein